MAEPILRSWEVWIQFQKALNTDCLLSSKEPDLWKGSWCKGTGAYIDHLAIREKELPGLAHHYYSVTPHHMP